MWHFAQAIFSLGLFNNTLFSIKYWCFIILYRQISFGHYRFEGCQNLKVVDDELLPVVFNYANEIAPDIAGYCDLQ